MNRKIEGLLGVSFGAAELFSGRRRNQDVLEIFSFQTFLPPAIYIPIIFHSDVIFIHDFF
jgi:hypothetical protein